jgi:NAD-dependent SIR2 family protein deacetylase
LQGKRSLKIGRLRPNVLLYGEPYLDDKEILETAKHDLRICPELVLIVGTKLGIPGARSIAANFCHAARSVGGTSFWISKEEPVSSVKALCDYVLIRDCDKVVPLDIFKLSINSGYITASYSQLHFAYTLEEDPFPCSAGLDLSYHCS